MAKNKLFTEDKADQWKKGLVFDAYKQLGAHIQQKPKGVRFAVWAPNARGVSVVGDFNSWDGRKNPLEKDPETGIWSGFVPDIGEGALYKYEIKPQNENVYPFLRSDPYAFKTELRPKTASVVHDLSGYHWKDDEWMQQRSQKNHFEEPMAIYEVHLGSWKRKGIHGSEFFSYEELAYDLVPYLKWMGFTHVELMPIAEHPYDPSWGYQITGYFAPTRRFGDPEDLMLFVNECHKNGIGVILDWVPGHFPKDDHGLQMYDGQPLYEYADTHRREHQEWGTHVFDYGRAGVRNFLISNARFWCQKYHIDGLRVDAVASMLYLDYSREEGKWSPNEYGGKENLEAIGFLRETNDVLHEEFPGLITFAEESTSWKGVTSPTSKGGLGFDFKWNMGWMNDTLSYVEMDISERFQNSEKITFPMVYSMDENFVLPLSHDEVVHLKSPLVYKSPGNHDEQFSNLRLLLTYMIGYPGKKLLFMGNEFAQTSEWSEARSLDWHLMDYAPHQGMQKLVKDLLSLYQKEPSLFEVDFEYEGFEWNDVADQHKAFFTFMRKARDWKNHLLFLLNFSPNMIEDYQVEVMQQVNYTEILNTDSSYYNGNNRGGFSSTNQTAAVAPYSALILRPDWENPRE